MNKIIRDSSCVPVNKYFSLHEGMNDDSDTKGGIVNISHDYNAGEKWELTAHLRCAVHANFKDICRKQETIKEREVSQKSIINSVKTSVGDNCNNQRVRKSLYIQFNKEV